MDCIGQARGGSKVFSVTENLAQGGLATGKRFSKMFGKSVAFQPGLQLCSNSGIGMGVGNKRGKAARFI